MSGPSLNAATHHQDSRVIMTDDPATAIYTAFAKIYTMNPSNKTFWLPSSSSAVPVSFYFDKHRSVYRIISYDKKDLLVNSTIFPTMTFIKTSTTFGLWSDTKLRTIYGLGFTSNDTLAQFGEWFEKIVKAAKSLDENLPLPPPAQSAVSVGGEDNSSKVNPNTIGPPDPDLQHLYHSGTSIASSTSWNNEVDKNYAPPKTVHVVDSTLELHEGRGAGDGDYEVGQMSTSPMAQLALENLQYQREVLKVKQLEIELSSMRTTVNTMHEALHRKSLELEKLKKESAETKEEIMDLKSQLSAKDEHITKLEESEVILREEVELLKIQRKGEGQELSDRKEEIKYLKAEVDKMEEVRKENEILKERLRQLQSEFDVADKNWDTVDMSCCEMTGIIQGLINIQSRLKQVVPAPPCGE
ncbi:unnamed protein product [Orchesella dallaii]|uniref:WH1 domain-containing protein n=1 Tax=Orchesella dallaii TaxID=48710 RepID=A0ABP1QQG8_9HEXA